MGASGIFKMHYLFSYKEQGVVIYGSGSLRYLLVRIHYVHNSDFKAIEGMTLLTSGLLTISLGTEIHVSIDLLLDYYGYSVVTEWLEG